MATSPATAATISALPTECSSPRCQIMSPGLQRPVRQPSRTGGRGIQRPMNESGWSASGAQSADDARDEGNQPNFSRYGRDRRRRRESDHRIRLSSHPWNVGETRRHAHFVARLPGLRATTTSVRGLPVAWGPPHIELRPTGRRASDGSATSWRCFGGALGTAVAQSSTSDSARPIVLA